MLSFSRLSVCNVCVIAALIVGICTCSDLFSFCCCCCWLVTILDQLVMIRLSVRVSESTTNAMIMHTVFKVPLSATRVPFFPSCSVFLFQLFSSALQHCCCVGAIATNERSTPVLQLTSADDLFRGFSGYPSIIITLPLFFITPLFRIATASNHQIWRTVLKGKWQRCDAALQLRPGRGRGVVLGKTVPRERGILPVPSQGKSTRAVVQLAGNLRRGKL